MKKQFPFNVSLFIFLTMIFLSLGPVTSFGDPIPEAKGYLGMDWGTSLADAQKAKGLSTTVDLDRAAARAADYLLMDFHEVKPDDPARPPSFSVLKAQNDDTRYIFYNGKYCMALTPISERDCEKVQKAIGEKYKRLDSADYRSFLDHDSADDGWNMLQLLYTRYDVDPGSRAYFVKANIYYEDISDPMKPAAGFLIYVSDDYFKNGAFAQWRKNLAEMPARKKAESDNETSADVAKVQ
jgi:hypothetical protein